MLIKMKCSGKERKEIKLIELQDIEKLGKFCLYGLAMIFVLNLISGNFGEADKCNREVVGFEIKWQEPDPWLYLK